MTPYVPALAQKIRDEVEDRYRKKEQLPKNLNQALEILHKTSRMISDITPKSSKLWDVNARLDKAIEYTTEAKTKAIECERED